VFTEEPSEYLIGFKAFLRAQHAGKDDPVVVALIAEIDREFTCRLASFDWPEDQALS
jgi:hypothetical protein